MCLLASLPQLPVLTLDGDDAASLSRPDTAEHPPRLYHSLRQAQKSVLSLAADPSHIYSGSQGADILVSDAASRC